MTPTPTAIAAALTGIPEATLAALMDGTMVAVARELLVHAYRDLCSPFPRETQVVASLGMGDTSIEKLRAMLAAATETQP